MELESDIIRCDNKVDGILSQEKYREIGEHSTYQVEKEYGSWSQMKNELGLLKPKISKEMIIEDLKESSKKDDDNYLSTYDYAEHGSFSVTMIRKKFGSWKNALKAADLNYENSNVRKKVSREEVIQEIKRLHEELGDINSVKFAEESKYSYAVVQKLDESWSDLLDELGIETKRYDGLSKEDMLEEARNEIDFVGNTLKHDRINKLSMSVATVRNKFGGLEKFYKEAGVWVDEDTVLEKTAKDCEGSLDQGFYSVSEVRNILREQTEIPIGNGNMNTIEVLKKMEGIKFRRDKAGNRIYIDTGRFDSKESYMNHLVSKFWELNNKLDEENQIDEFDGWKEMIGRGYSPTGSFAAIAYIKNDDVTQKQIGQKLDCTEVTIRNNTERYEDLME